MKNTTQTVETEVTDGAKTIKDYIKSLIETKKDGEVTLDELAKQAKNISRHDLLEILKGFGHGTVVISGRKGAVSRLAYGVAAKSFLENRNVNQKKHARPRIHKLETPEPAHGFSLKISVAGQDVYIPITSDLVAA